MHSLNKLIIALGVFILCLLYFVEWAEYSYKKTTFAKLPNWEQDDVSKLYLPFRLHCEAMGKEHYQTFTLPILNKPKKWQHVCEEVANIHPATFKQFVEENLEPYKLDSRTPMLYTGYYKPIIEVSYDKTDVYKYPLYATPKDIIRADLKDFGMEAGGEIRGRIVGDRLIPYHTRKEIDGGKLDTEILLWAKSAADVFFLQIQGSGKAVFEKTPPVHIAYAGNNGHGYTSIGRVLVEKGEMKKEEVSLYSIKKWLADNPEKATELMQQNARYIFFKLVDAPSEGSLKIPLIAERSLAVDPNFIPLGAFVFVSTEVTANDAPFNQLFLAQDTGAAITGPDRADIFFGEGQDAEAKAAYQNSRGVAYILVPR